MKILVHDYSGHPFQVELSRSLARRGHRVLHVHCPSYESGKGDLNVRQGDPEGLGIAAIDLGRRFEKYSVARRVQQELRYARKFVRRAQQFDADVILSGNCPLIAHAAISRWAARRRVPFVYWQQDIYGVAMADEAKRRIPVVGPLIARASIALERRLALRSSAVICISEDFVPVLRGWGVPVDLIEVIENWAPIDELPVRPKANAWAAEHGLSETKNCVYAGTIGLKHDGSLLLALAEACRAVPAARVVVVSAGDGAERLSAARGSSGLDHLVVVGFQPYERLPDVLGAADVLLLILGSEAGAFSVPSKLLTYLCAGRAVVASVPAENQAARTLTASGAAVLVPPGDADAFAAAVVGLLGDAQALEVMGRSARAFAEQTFDIGRVTDRFEAVLDRACGGRFFLGASTGAPPRPAPS